MWPKYEDKYSEDRPLCCCGYRDLQGNRNHLLALCCNCQAVDESFERLMTCRRIPSDLLDQITFVINDRLRVPYPGGAQRVDFKKIVYLFIPPCCLFISTVNILFTVPVMIGLSILIYRLSTSSSRHQFSFILFLSMMLS